MGVPALYLQMFVRKKKNKSGVISIQVIEKSKGKYKVLKTIGSSSRDLEIELYQIHFQMTYIICIFRHENYRNKREFSRFKTYYKKS